LRLLTFYPSGRLGHRAQRVHPDSGNGSVTELKAATGELVKVLSGAAYPCDDPDAMAVAGGELFVANQDGNSVTVLPL
jgi:hypothetical protein